MTIAVVLRSLAGVAVVAGLASSLSVLPAMAEDTAQQNCTCVIGALTGPLGKISQASADVFVTASAAQQAAVAGTPLDTNSVVTTGALASAQIDLGAGCSFSMKGSMRMQIVPMQDTTKLCVQVYDQSPPPAPVGDATGAVVGGAAVLGGGVLVTLGMLQPVSN